jgi:hypothetical protein
MQTIEMGKKFLNMGLILSFIIYIIFIGLQISADQETNVGPFL